MAYICSEMRKHAQLAQNKGKKLRVVFIDHAHRITYDCSQKPMTYAMGDDARMLKNTAADLGIAVVLLCQLNENSKDRNPTSYDILDTSRIRHEMQAFIGLRLYREESNTYFGIFGHDRDSLTMRQSFIRRTCKWLAVLSSHFQNITSIGLQKSQSSLTL